MSGEPDSDSVPQVRFTSGAGSFSTLCATSAVSASLAVFCFNQLYRRVAENAEVAQRVEPQSEPVH